MSEVHLMIFSSRRNPEESAANIQKLDISIPGWRYIKHSNGKPVMMELCWIKMEIVPFLMMLTGQKNG